MNRKIKILIYLVIIFDVIFMGIWGINKYLWKGSVSTANLNADTVYESKDIELKYNYGDYLKGFTIYDVSDDPLTITADYNKFKYFRIDKRSTEDKLNIDFFVGTASIRKDIEDENLDVFHLVMIDKLSESKKRELLKIQKKLNIHICLVQSEELIEIFSIPECKCGIDILLAKDNAVRFFNFSGGFKLIKDIISKELKR